MSRASHLIVFAALASCTACQAVTGQTALSFREETSAAGTGGKDPEEAGSTPPSAAGEGGAPSAGKPGASGQGGKDGTSVAGNSGNGGVPAACAPTIAGAPCDLVKQCGCDGDDACYVTDVQGTVPVVACTKATSPVSPGNICASRTSCTEGYGCVGTNPGTCRQYCNTDPDCGPKGRCKAVQATIDGKRTDIKGYNVCFEACTKSSECATGCCSGGVCAAASYCACTNNSDCGANGCCEDGVCKSLDQCKVVSHVPELQCGLGSERYVAPPFATGECGQCVTANCCNEWVACQRDKDCFCFTECLEKAGANRASCLTECKVTETPKASEWGTCAMAQCKSSCNLDMPAPMMCRSATEAGFVSGTCTTSPQCGCSAGQKCDVSASGVTSCGSVGTSAAYGTCTSDASCQAGYGCVGGVCMQYCSKAGDTTCDGATDSCRTLAGSVSGMTIPGGFACFRCDPVDPSRVEPPYGSCKGKCLPTVDGTTGCTAATGTGTHGSACMKSDGEADGGLCAPGFFCEIDTKKCAKYCHVGSTGECPSGTACGSFATEKYAAAVEIGGCF